MDAVSLNRPGMIRRGRRLEYFTVAWNSLEAAVSIIAGLFAGSISLVGFGLDSAIEVASGAALLWRLRHDSDPSLRNQVERSTLRFVGACFIALALYIVYESCSTLIRHESPQPSIPGIIMASAALLVMPMLAKAKRRVAAGIGSEAMHADSKQADFCAYLSAILLSGLLLNAVLSWWWADAVAGLLMVPTIVREGVGALRGKSCYGGCN
jgi:divalent metal cation (Fe/Co/Zn/Cd) transporter